MNLTADQRRRLRDLAPPLLGLLFVLCFAFAVLTAGGAGTGAAPDSGHYLDTARRLSSGQGFTTGRLPADATTESVPLTTFAPLYSVLLSVAMSGGADAFLAARRVGVAAGVAFAGLIFAIVLAAGGRDRWPLATVAAAAAMLTPGVHGASRMALSDLPAAVVALAAVAAALHAARDRLERWGPWAAVGALMGLCLLARYAFLYLSVALFAGLAGAAWGRLSNERLLARLAVTAGLFGLVGGPWLMRNRAVGGDLVGIRKVEVVNAFDSAMDSLNGLSTVLLPVNIPHQTGLALVGFGVALVGAAVFVVRGHASQAWRDPAVRLLAITGAVYWLLMVASLSVSPADALDRSRYWLVAPALAAGIVAAVARVQPTTRYAAAVTAPVVLAMGLSVSPALTYFAATDPPAREHQGWRGETFTASGFGAAVADLEDCAVYTNAPRFVLLWHEPVAVRELPWEHAAIEALVQRPEPVCIVELLSRLPRSRRLHSEEWTEALDALSDAGALTMTKASKAGRIFVSAEPHQ